MCEVFKCHMCTSVFLNVNFHPLGQAERPDDDDGLLDTGLLVGDRYDRYAWNSPSEKAFVLQKLSVIKTR